MPIPEKIANAPTLLPGNDLFMRAFSDLTTCRQIGFDSGPIPWRDIVMWSNENGIVGQQKENLIYIIGRMDKAYLDWKIKQNGNQQP